jgi:hypothetical protein
MLGIGSHHYWKRCSQYSKLASCKYIEFLKQNNHPFWFYKLSQFWTNWEKAETTWARSSASVSGHRCPDRADDVQTTAASAPPSFHCLWRRQKEHPTVEHPPFSFLLCPLHRHCAVVLIIAEPPWTYRFGPSPTTSTHPKHRTTEYFLPSRSDHAGDPCSGFPTSIPRRQSPPPWTSLLVRPPLHRHQSNTSSPATPPPTIGHGPAGLCRQAVGIDGGEELPCFRSWAKKAIWAKPLYRARPSASMDPSPLQ